MISHKLSYSITTFWEFLIYTEAALEAEEETAALVSLVAAPLSGFATLHAEELEAARQERKMEALVGRANFVLDASLTKLHNGLLAHVELKRDAPAFARIFSEPLSDETSFGLDKQLDVNRDALAQLQLSPELYPAAFVQGVAAKAVRDAHKVKQANMRLRFDAWKQEVNTALTAVESALNNIASQKQLGRKWPASFLA